MTSPPTPPQLQKNTLIRNDGLAVLDVLCDCRENGWSEHEHPVGYMLVLPRRGVFLRRVAGREMLLDPGVAYFQRPDMPHQIAHPRPGGDACTVISLPEDLLAELAGGEPNVPDDPVFTDGAVDLAQRALVARLRSGDCGEFEAAEQAVRLTAQVLEQWRPERVRGGLPGTALTRRRLVDEAREILAADPTTIKLARLAKTLGVSPYHLSRVFHEETGGTLAKHRNRLRVRLALERIEGGERNLAGLAFDLGFADHAHLTRTVRSEVGVPPVRTYPLLGDANDEETPSRQRP
jgi:AraC-like DNA-binding protein